MMHNKTKLNFIVLLLLIFNFSFIKGKDSTTTIAKWTTNTSSKDKSLETFVDKYGNEHLLPTDAREIEKLKNSTNENLKPKTQPMHISSQEFTNRVLLLTCKNQYDFEKFYQYQIGNSYLENTNLFLNKVLYLSPHYKEFIKHIPGYKDFIYKIGEYFKDNKHHKKEYKIPSDAPEQQWVFVEFVQKEHAKFLEEDKAQTILLQEKQKAEELENAKRAEETSRKLYLSNFCQNLSGKNKQTPSSFSSSQLTTKEKQSRQIESVTQEAKKQEQLVADQAKFRVKQNHYLNYLNKISTKQNLEENINEFATHPSLSSSDFFNSSDLSPKKLLNLESFHKINNYRELKSLFDCQNHFQKIEKSKNNNLEKRIAHLGQQFVSYAEQELFNGTSYDYEKYRKRTIAINETLLKNSKYTQTYTLNSNLKTDLESKYISFDQFANFKGNSIQQNINNELVEILNNTSELNYAYSDNSYMQRLTSIIYRTADFAHQCSITNIYEAAYNLSDFCKHMLDITIEIGTILTNTAIAMGEILIDGVSQGLKNSFNYFESIITNPQKALENHLKAGYLLCDTLGAILAAPTEETPFAFETECQASGSKIACDKYDQVSTAIAKHFENKSVKEVLTEIVTLGTENIATAKVFASASKFLGELGTAIKIETEPATALIANKFSNAISKIKSDASALTTSNPQLIIPSSEIIKSKKELFTPITKIVEQAGSELQNIANNAKDLSKKVIQLAEGNDLKHIFRNKTGHLLDTPKNRELLISIAQDKTNFLIKDKHEIEWFSKITKEGEQIWVGVRNYIIRHGGINKTPRECNPITGLCKQFKPQ